MFLESIQLTLRLKRAAALGEIIVEPLRYLLMGKEKKSSQNIKNLTIQLPTIAFKSALKVPNNLCV